MDEFLNPEEPENVPTFEDFNNALEKFSTPSFEKFNSALNKKFGITEQEFKWGGKVQNWKPFYSAEGEQLRQPETELEKELEPLEYKWMTEGIQKKRTAIAKAQEPANRIPYKALPIVLPGFAAKGVLESVVAPVIGKAIKGAKNLDEKLNKAIEDIPVPLAKEVAQAKRLAGAGVSNIAGLALNAAGWGIEQIGRPGRYFAEELIMKPMGVPQAEAERASEGLDLAANPINYVSGLFGLAARGARLLNAGREAVKVAETITPAMKAASAEVGMGRRAAQLAQDVAHTGEAIRIRQVRLSDIQRELGIKSKQGATPYADAMNAQGKAEAQLEKLKMENVAAQGAVETGQVVKPEFTGRVQEAAGEVGKVKAAEKQVKQAVRETQQEVASAQNKAIKARELQEQVKANLKFAEHIPPQVAGATSRQEHLTRVLEIEEEISGLQTKLKTKPSRSLEKRIMALEQEQNEIAETFVGKTWTIKKVKSELKKAQGEASVEQFHWDEMERQSGKLQEAQAIEQQAIQETMAAMPRVPDPGSLGDQLLGTIQRGPEVAQELKTQKGLLRDITSGGEKLRQKAIATSIEIERVEPLVKELTEIAEDLQVLEWSKNTTQGAVEYATKMEQLGRIGQEVGLTGDALLTRLKTGAGLPGLSPTVAQQLASRERYLVKLGLPFHTTLENTLPRLAKEIEIFAPKPITTAWEWMENVRKVVGLSRPVQTDAAQTIIKGIKKGVDSLTHPESQSTVGQLLHEADIEGQQHRYLIKGMTGHVDGLIKKYRMDFKEQQLMWELADTMARDDAVAKNMVLGYIERIPDPIRREAILQGADGMFNATRLGRAKGLSKNVEEVWSKMEKSGSYNLPDLTQMVLDEVDGFVKQQPVDPTKTIREIQVIADDLRSAVTGEKLKAHKFGQIYRKSPTQAIKELSEQEARIISMGAFKNKFKNLFGIQMKDTTIPLGFTTLDDFAGFVFPEQFARQYERSKVLFERPSAFWEQVPGLTELNQLWKSMKTVGLLSFIPYEFQNIFSNKIRRWQFGTDLKNYANLRNEMAFYWVPSKSAVVRSKDTFINALKETPFYDRAGNQIGNWFDTILQPAMDQGLFDAGSFLGELKGEGFGRVSAKGHIGAYQEARAAGAGRGEALKSFVKPEPHARNVLSAGAQGVVDMAKPVAEKLEGWDRVCAYAAGIEQGLDPVTAGMMAWKSVVDYRKIGRFWQTVRATPLVGMPFISWSAKNIPNQLMLAVTQPRHYSFLMRMADAIQNGLINPDVQNRFVEADLKRQGLPYSYGKDPITGKKTLYINTGTRVFPAWQLLEWDRALKSAAEGDPTANVSDLVISQMGPLFQFLSDLEKLSQSRKNLQAVGTDESSFEKLAANAVGLGQLSKLGDFYRNVLKRNGTSDAIAKELVYLMANFIGLRTRTVTNENKKRFINSCQTSKRMIDKKYQDLIDPVTKTLSPELRQRMKHEKMLVDRMIQQVQSMKSL